MRGGAGEDRRGVRATAFCGATAAKVYPKPRRTPHGDESDAVKNAPG
jgi:hypothetical protein